MTASIDVVIPTRNRPGPLSALLADLVRQTVRPGEVILVDDSPEAVDWALRFPELRVTVVRPSRRAFISEAKNLGWSRGRGELVAFIDDDNRLPGNLLETLASDLNLNSGWGAVMPGVVYQKEPDVVWVYAAPFGDDRWTFDLVGRNAARDAQLEEHALPTDALPNLSLVRRSVLEHVGGFDELLPVNSSADLCQRIKRAGWEVWADPRVLTQHDVETPGTPGFWVEHTLEDRERFHLEVADWLRFHRRWNRAGPMFAVRAGYHSFGFLAPHFVALAARSPGRVVSHAAAAIAGFHEGLRSPRSDRRSLAAPGPVSSPGSKLTRHR